MKPTRRGGWADLMKGFKSADLGCRTATYKTLQKRNFLQHFVHDFRPGHFPALLDEGLHKGGQLLSIDPIGLKNSGRLGQISGLPAQERTGRSEKSAKQTSSRGRLGSRRRILHELTGSRHTIQKLIKLLSRNFFPQQVDQSIDAGSDRGERDIQFGRDGLKDFFHGKVGLG